MWYNVKVSWEIWKWFIKFKYIHMSQLPKLYLLYITTSYIFINKYALPWRSKKAIHMSIIDTRQCIAGGPFSSNCLWGNAQMFCSMAYAKVTWEKDYQMNMADVHYGHILRESHTHTRPWCHVSPLDTRGASEGTVACLQGHIWTTLIYSYMMTALPCRSRGCSNKSLDVCLKAIASV